MNLSFLNLISLSFFSSLQYIRLLLSGSLHFPSNRVRKWYEIKDKGNYKIFRETVSDAGKSDTSAVLIVGFRFKLLGSYGFLHWLFQRLCGLSTPIWCGFPGFHIKYWMVNKKGDYVGAYEWASEREAQHYKQFLVTLLRPVSVPGSIWYTINSNSTLCDYLQVDN